MSKLKKVLGPSTSTVKRSEAIDLLYDHPQFPKNARLSDIEEVDGKWVATLKFADFPFSDDGKGGGPDDEESGPPKPKKDNPFTGPNGDNDDEPVDESSDSDSDKPDDSDSDSDDKGKKGEKGEIAQLKVVLDAIADALGIQIPGAEGDSPIPGPDGLDTPDSGPPVPPPPHGGHPPEGGPPGIGAGPHGLKPGEAPPGTTPVGAPAFAKVQNPFPEHIGKQKAFEIADITDKPLSECIREIKSMVEPWGYHIHQCKASSTEDGNRRVAALVADHPPKH